jgi:hypothetical protein
MEGGREHEAVADSDGAFRIAAFRAGGASITVRAEGFVRRTVGNLRVEDGAETRVDIALEGALEIRGTVHEAGGEPAVGVRVIARNEDRRPPSGVRTGSGSTGADGSFRIPGLPAGTWTLTTSSPRHPPVSLPALPSGGPPVALRLPSPVSIQGRVADTAGNPLAGVRVSATPDSREGMRPVAGGRATTGLDGTFEIPNLAAGAYRLEARPPEGYSTGTAAGIQGGTRGFEFRLERSLVIVGRVLQPDGSPSGARGRIRILDAAGNQVGSTRWDSKGSFRTLGIPPGTYTLHARVAGPPALAGTASVPAGSEGVVIRLGAE